MSYNNQNEIENNNENNETANAEVIAENETEAAVLDDNSTTEKTSDNTDKTDNGINWDKIRQKYELGDDELSPKIEKYILKHGFDENRTDRKLDKMIKKWKEDNEDDLEWMEFAKANNIGEDEKFLPVFFKYIMPKWCKVCLIIVLINVITFVLSLISSNFADFWVRYPASFARMVMAKLTGWFPFSLAECFIMMFPILIILGIVIIMRMESLIDISKHLASAVTIMFILLSFYLSVFSSGYHTTSIDKKLGFERDSVATEDLLDTTKAISSLMGELTEGIVSDSDGASVMPYSFSVLNDKINEAYLKAAEKYDFLPSFTSTAKQIAHSEPYTYTHISGVYIPYTGEANININFPDYVIPFTMAHEMAHQRGISRENEANFVAFLVCMESDDTYIKYSAYMNVYEYLLDAVYYADEDSYIDIWCDTNIACRYEMSAYSKFFRKYRRNIAATISNVINDTTLKAQGQSEGSRSYDLVTDLTVAYYKAGLLVKGEEK